MKTLIKATLLIAFVVSANYAKADCTLTTKKGTDGRCFQVNGEYECLQRDEDTSCYVPITEPTDPSVGG